MAGAAVSLRLQASQVQLQLSSPSISSGVQEVSRVGFSSPSSSASLASEAYPRQWQHQSSRLRQAWRVMAAHAEAPEAVATSSGSGSCCGGSGGASGGGCSGSKKSADVSGLGKEFEAMVASSTMAELEKGYVKGEMQGMITRDVVQEVMAIPEASSTASAEKFLDVDEILSDARKMSTGDFVFEADLDEMIV